MDQVSAGIDGLPVRDSGLWAKDKLYYLDRYLDIFSVGMKRKWAKRLYYIDLFSGPGVCRIRDTQEEIEGSPLIALKYDFESYFFFELEPSLCEALSERIAKQFPEKKQRVKIIPGDCNKEIHRQTLPTSGLGTTFIDPTGISQIPFDTIRALANPRKTDLIINFPEGMGIRMNFHQYSDNERNALNRFIGSARWQERFQRELTSFDQACRAIAQEYLENLRGLGYLAVDSDWIPVKTDRNVLLYYLLFGSKHPRGNEYWRKISLIDHRGQRRLGF